jgi:hypothetical protein
MKADLSGTGWSGKIPLTGNFQNYISEFHLRQQPAPNPRVQTAKVDKERLSKRYLTYANIYARLVYISSDGNRQREGELHNRKSGDMLSC